MKFEIEDQEDIGFGFGIVFKAGMFLVFYKKLFGIYWGEQ